MANWFHLRYITPRGANVQELTLDELTFQLCQLEAALELRVGDLPASQIIRAATRRIELQRREIEALRSTADGWERQCGLHQRQIKSGVELMRSAIASGDWKVDGACDPESWLSRATDEVDARHE